MQYPQEAHAAIVMAVVAVVAVVAIVQLWQISNGIVIFEWKWNMMHPMRTTQNTSTSMW
jgi:hypothetical protein